ncbi:hypothetical protein AB0300_18635 [Microbacterium sp. NPDC078814]|uniref:hypothetical protein n=1 Tax=Microbacterium sp. NPDC078814 TaxID=3154767 RepID=UPI00344FFFA8
MGGTLTKVDIGHGRGWLEVEAAKSQARIDRALGHPQQITEAGRSWEQQNEHWQHYLRFGAPIALHPDTPSVHQMGRAKDTDERDVALMNDHGWFQTVYRWVNGRRTLVEPWHFEYDPARDNHRNDPAPAGGGATAALKTKEFPMFDALYVKQTDGQKPDKDRIFAIFRDPRTGELVKEHITDGGLWAAIGWGLKRRGVTITSEGMKAAELNKIPTWKK